MELPKFNETFLPILEVLSNGNTIKGRELVRVVEARFYSDLPQELLDKTTKSGDRLIENRIAWGKSYLKKGGLVHYPQRGYVQITEKGKSAKPENVSLNDIQSNVISFYEPENQSGVKPDIESNASPQDLIDSGFEQIEREVKDELLSKLKEVDPYAFEKIILLLLNKMGYGDFIETAKSGDGGIDGIINEDQLDALVKSRELSLLEKNGLHICPLTAVIALPNGWRCFKMARILPCWTFYETISLD